MRDFNILVYTHEPSGYGDWCGPEGLVRELLPEIEQYIVNGSKQKGKQIYVLTDYYVPAHYKKWARLYVPKGTTAQETGLELSPVLKLVGS